MITFTAFQHAAESYNVTGGEALYEVREAYRSVYLAGRDAIDAGQRSAEVAQAQERIARRGY